MATRAKVAFLVDGYNLFHAICELKRPELKWLCLRSLAQAFLDPSQEELAHVVYFSAIAQHRGSPNNARHWHYIRALESTGVRVELGIFKQKSFWCPGCSFQTTRHEEKRTDVNVASWFAISLLGLNVDRILLVSGDSDFATLVERAVKARPRGVRVIFPPHRDLTAELLQASGQDRVAQIKELHLERSQLPDEIDTGKHGIVRRPLEWRADYVKPPATRDLVPSFVRSVLVKTLRDETAAGLSASELADRIESGSAAEIQRLAERLKTLCPRLPRHRKKNAKGRRRRR